MTFKSAADTDVGLHRQGNEDAFLHAPKHGLFVVADGMGGHDGGEIASAMTIDSFRVSMRVFDDPDTTAPWAFLPDMSDEENFIHGSIQWANDEIARLNAHKTLDNFVKGNVKVTDHMGTTVVALLIRDGKAIYGHAGDSRLYLLRDDVLKQLTQDQTVGQKYMDSGVVIPPHVAKSGMYAALTQAVGLEVDLKVPMVVMDTKPGDVFLLCSDGLTNEVPDEVLQLAMAYDKEPKSVVKTLIGTAKACGGRDNITAIVVRID